MLRSLILSGILLLTSVSSYASHIVGAELTYRWVSGMDYQVTVVLYGDCSSTAGVFPTLTLVTPQVCVFNGTTLFTTMTLSRPVPVCGTEVTPVCPDSIAYTTCSSLAYSIPGIKKFVCTGTVTLSGPSANWRFVYTSNNGGGGGSWSCPGTLGSGTGSPGGAGRSSAITSIAGVGGTLIQLIDTLNNSATNTRGHNSSPVLTVEPVPFFCPSITACYNPGAVDLYDVSPSQPAGDSLMFHLAAATNGTGGCGAVGGPCSYLFGLSGSNPLQLTSSGTMSLDPLTGQMCFNGIAQRSVVVYNVREFRDDTVSTTPLLVNRVLVGTMQREMTYLVLPFCTLTTPVGKIDSFSGPGDTLSGTHFFSCANSGSFNVFINPTTPDPTLRITVTATGLSTGFTYAVVGDGTSTPRVTLTGNTALILPGTYIIYFTFTDNHCPLVGTKTYAFTFDILPVPAITATTVSPATCDSNAVVRFDPGGTGKPWRIKLSYDPPLIFPLVDTFNIFPPDTAAVFDSLPPGRYYATIFTAASNNCNVGVPFVVDTPHFTITAAKVDPTYCGANDGFILLNGLTPGKLDTVLYKYQGTLQPRRGFYSSPSGTDTIFNLLAGTYDSIVVQEGFCFTNPEGPLTLINPPFTWRTVTTREISKCGFCNGIDTLFGLHPGQLDTITYNFVPATGGPVSTLTSSSFIGLDSMVVLSGMCAGTYSNFIVNTAGVCSFTVPGPFLVGNQDIIAEFDSVIHYGCRGDTLMFNNLSWATSLADSDLTYKWYFGDGYTDTATNPRHIYTNTKGATYTAKLFISNSKCIDSSISVILLDNYVESDFAFSPTPFVCQDSLVGFTSTATGTNLTYLWDFGDGNFDFTANPVHSFKNTGKYNVKLIAENHLIPMPTNGSTFKPCYDTLSRMIEVDSLSEVSITATDTVVCMGQAITFRGNYSGIGDTLVSWGFGDGNATVGMDPIIHSFEGEGLFTVNLNVKYRSCPENSGSRRIRVFRLPEIYLGPDAAICPGGVPLTLHDDRNDKNIFARWKWSTGETGPGITVVKPGYYSAVVTVDGCTASDTVWVQKDCYIDIPNVFTPNGDGTNDYFFPRQMLTRGLTTFKMEIFNRWGQLIYETTSTNGNGWDGNFNDKEQPVGVYVYRIEAKFKDGQIENHQGNVTLLR